MLRAGSLCFPTSCMFTLALTALTICHRLERALSTLGSSENNHTAPSHLWGPWTAGRGVGGGFGRVWGPLVRQPSPSRRVMHFPFSILKACGGVKGNKHLLKSFHESGTGLCVQAFIEHSEYPIGIGHYGTDVMFLSFVDETLSPRKRKWLAQGYTTRKGWIQGLPSSKALILSTKH